ncbi:histidine kinase [Desulfosporosinus sp. HMP52]|uniref:LytR/AlgR family response regulator transcription factor n=1 Tax=Desulfosporosinus sp. HMP52 TaxID=1487923 RepID=UPI00051FCACF|nr:LytTR family DNA-binding domain-containing protein [Desulfosporosinus sp. HMP52]KGK85055.1 histidine kinase [Desulfosporosinus sp. HMP52]
MRIAVIDDERPARSELMHQLLEIIPEAIISEADSGSAALEIMSKETFDLVFIDINLGDIEGTVLASTVQQLMPKAHIIFATAYSQYALLAFEIGVSNYILKPFEKSRLEKIVAKCRKESEASCTKTLSNRLPVNCNRRIILVDISSIVYIETDNRSCVIHTKNGDLTENLAIREYEKRLFGHRFFRIHKSYLVNLEEVREIFPWHNNSFALKMVGYEDQILPVGREKIKELKQILKI